MKAIWIRILSGWHTNRSKGIAYRKGHRRAMSLLEAALSLVVIGFAVDQGLRLVTDHTAERALQSEARMLTAVADEYADTVGRFLPPSVTLGRVTTHIPPAHIGLETPFGREIRLAHFTPAVGQLVVMAYTWSANRQTNKKPVPRYDSHIRQIGYVVAGTNDRCARNHICGPGMDWDATALLGVLGTDGPGAEDLVALRWLTMEINAYPYLHRNSISGHPDLNRLETDLNMGGHDIEGINALDAQSVVVEDELESGATLTVGEMTMSGDMTIAGNLVTTGTYRADDMKAENDASITTLWINERLEMEDATVSGDLTIDDIRVNSGIEMTGTEGIEVRGTVHVNEAEFNSLIITGDLNGAVLDYEGRATTLSRVRTRDMITNNLIVGSCINC